MAWMSDIGGDIGSAFAPRWKLAMLLALGPAASMSGCIKVNPAFDEIAEAGSETGLPGDGDPSGDGDGEPLASCKAPLEYVDCDLGNTGAAGDPFAALGLGCDGAVDQTVPIASAEFSVTDPDSWRVAAYFGSATGPNHGGKLWAARDGQSVPSTHPDYPTIPPNTSASILVLSTGTLPPVAADGGLTLEYDAQVGLGENLNPDGGEFPAPISPLHGSNQGNGGSPFVACDLINDCSDSLHAQWFDLGWNQLGDKIALSFTMVAPEGVHGYVFDFAFFSSEYPQWIDTGFNDMFVAWSTSEDYTGNLTFIGETPMNTTSLAAAGGFDHVDLDPALTGTGFETHGATGWLLARGPATGGQKVVVTLFISDLGDQLLGSVVLLDNFRWDCGGCVGGECGFQP